LFHGRPDRHPRLLFKGGTSLSKAFRLIARFSEDIDITVFRDDLGQPATVEQLESLTGKQRRRRLEEIRDACRAYLSDQLRPTLQELLSRTLAEAEQETDGVRVEGDALDAEGQTLLVWYPSVTTDGQDEYIRPAVRIESGAKSALDPHVTREVTAYAGVDLPELDLSVRDVLTVHPSRTFWDKVVILHGLRRWFDRRGELRQEGERISRHYYDVHCLMQNEVGTAAAADLSLGSDCVRHAQLFFNRPDFDLASAVPGNFALRPVPEMLDRLRRDYERMAGMLFRDEVPAFEAVMDSVATLETRLNT